MGMVVEPGPDKNADKTTSSRDSVKVSSQAEAMACEINGSVTRKNNRIVTSSECIRPIQYSTGLCCVPRSSDGYR
jgi:hypothetical protein